MPPFILEKLRHSPMENRRPTTLYCKKSYNPLVKVTGWERDQDSQPIDTNPLCSDGFNLHYSHYNHLGNNLETDWKTTTEEMLQQVHSRRRDLNTNRQSSLVNIYTSIKCLKDDGTQKICSSPYSQDYSTTMQHDYDLPYPYPLKRLAMPETPVLLNRRMSCTGNCKFLDDDFATYTKLLQNHKSMRYRSYNPSTGYYTDGTPGKVQKSKCVDIKVFA